MFSRKGRCGNSGRGFVPWSCAFPERGRFLRRLSSNVAPGLKRCNDVGTVISKHPLDASCMPAPCPPAYTARYATSTNLPNRAISSSLPTLRSFSSFSTPYTDRDFANVSATRTMKDSNSTSGIAYRKSSERINKQYLQHALLLIQQGWHCHLSTSVSRSIFGIHLKSFSLLAELYQRQ